MQYGSQSGVAGILPQYKSNMFATKSALFSTARVHLDLMPNIAVAPLSGMIFSKRKLGKGESYYYTQGLRPKCQTVPVPIGVGLWVRTSANQCQAANMTA
jgi:hypothetical protein